MIESDNLLNRSELETEERQQHVKKQFLDMMESFTHEQEDDGSDVSGDYGPEYGDEQDEEEN